MNSSRIAGKFLEGELGALDNLMQAIAERHGREVKPMGARIEPILIGGLGVLVLGVFLPIWDMGKAVIYK